MMQYSRPIIQPNTVLGEEVGNHCQKSQESEYSKSGEKYFDLKLFFQLPNVSI